MTEHLDDVDAAGPAGPAGLAVDRLRRVYGVGPDAVTAIDHVTMTVRPHELLCIVGPSGCGKTTLLRCIAGLLAPTSGEVRLDGRVVTAPLRAMTLVFQDYSRSLLPWMTVRANVALPLVARRPRPTRAERDDITAEVLGAVGLGRQGSRYPWQLSAGMQQRVAIARALAYRPEVLLLDEPFASVDAQTRAELQDLLLDVWHRTGLTVLFVTHDIDEAVYLGDRVLVLAASPTKVVDAVEVDLPRPRDQITTKALPRFAALRERLYRAVKAEATGGGDRENA